MEIYKCFNYQEQLTFSGNRCEKHENVIRTRQAHRKFIEYREERGDRNAVRAFERD